MDLAGNDLYCYVVRIQSSLRSRLQDIDDLEYNSRALIGIRERQTNIGKCELEIHWKCGKLEEGNSDNSTHKTIIYNSQGLSLENTIRMNFTVSTLEHIGME